MEAKIVEEIKRIIGNSKNKCYYASEAAYHLLGGKTAGYTPCVGQMIDTGALFDTHWWLRRADGSVLDITADQFDFIYPYEKGRGCGFMTRYPSKKAREIIAGVMAVVPETRERLEDIIDAIIHNLRR